MSRNTLSKGYWYSLIAASPNPESEESANVAVVVGNGRATRLEFLDHLPRLCGLATREDVAVFQTILGELAEQVNRGMDPTELQALLGPQLRVMRTRQLFRAPSDDLLSRLKSQYLERPIGMSVADATRALLRRSTARLDDALANATGRVIDITPRATPRRLYGHKLDRHVGYRVPPVARAVRLPDVDVLIDSILVEPETRGRPLNQAAVHVSRAFFAYSRLRPIIRAVANRDVATIGVLHASRASDDTETLQRREWVRHIWSADATVIDGNEYDVATELRARLDALR
ncbi:MAG TPA: hypothetical protein VEA99_18105 [Gemmatimonadaceae bacterium]|nr:hypothetical protein [Gemmatimonadaceae bacterium]